MGRDKATLRLDDRTLTEHVLDALRPVAATALLAGRAIDGIDVPAIPDRYPNAGPLGAIASALDAVTTDYAVVAACDMPSIVPALLTLLLEQASQHPNAEATMCTTDRGLEPLLSVWRPKLAAPKLHAALTSGIRAVHDAVAALPHALLIPQARWQTADPRGDSFRNWNTPADLH
jgi:molybdopterin-guanine dinucleotide biosynthesis protein A